MSRGAAVEKLAYSIDEVVALTTFSRSTLYRMIKAGELASSRKHGRRYVLRDDLMAMLRSDAA